MDDPIVVGIDQLTARPALRWAAAEALAQRVRLHLVHARPLLGTALRERAADSPSALAELADEVRRGWPGLTVTASCFDGPAAEVLIAEARAARMLVAGGVRHGIRSVLRGEPIARSVARRAGCPVVLVGDLPTPVGPVVLGVDAAAPNEAAAGFAFEYAHRHGLGLTAIHAWGVSDLPYPPGDPRIPPIEELSLRARRALDDALAAWREKYPRVRVIARTRVAPPGTILRAAAPAAALVVVGTRTPGRGEPRLGTTVDALTTQTRRILAVVPEPR